MEDFDDDDDDDVFDDEIDPADFLEPAQLPERVGWRYSVHYCTQNQKLVMFGEYEGMARIGAGSYGYVFRARDPKLDRLVAIKICKLADEEHREMFLREAQLIARLSHHPNIVTIHELGRFESDVEGDEFDGAPFMVMELASDLPDARPPIRTAKDLLRMRLCWEDAVDFYRAAGRGLAAAHAEGIVHGDFKPSNVLLGKGRPMVADFGLAHTLGSADGHTGGTEGYRAPELYGSGGNSPKADQFALCVSLWEMIVGSLPVDETMAPRPCPPGVMPQRLIEALLRGMSVEPADRWASMNDLLDELRQIRATSKVPRPKRPPGGFLTHMIVGGLVGAAIFALIMERRPELANELPSTEPSADRVEQSERAEQGGEDVESDKDAERSQDAEQTACTITDDVFVEPSEALEKVCKMIRAGQLQDAAGAWKRALEERTPERTQAQLRYAVSETQVVIHTCEHYLTTLDDGSPLKKRAQHLLELMRDAYETDNDELRLLTM